jgi:hypothetical protein
MVLVICQNVPVFIRHNQGDYFEITNEISQNFYSLPYITHLFLYIVYNIFSKFGPKRDEVTGE